MTVREGQYKRPTLFGNLKRLFIDPCSPDQSVWAEIGLAAELLEGGLWGMAWDVIDPDFKEVYHKIGGRSLVCDVKSTIKAGLTDEGFKNSKLTKGIFWTLEREDMALWYMFLFYAAERGLMDMSTIIIKNECPGKKHSPYYGSGPAFFGGLDKSGRWQGADFSMNDGSIYAPVSPSTIIVKPGFSGIVNASAKWSPVHHDTSGSVSARIINRTEGTVFDVDEGSVNELSTSNNICFMSSYYSNPYNHNVEIGVEWSFTGTQSEAGTAVVLVDGFCTLFAVK